MSEGLFILTTIFVAYVVYVMVNERKANAKSITPTVRPDQQLGPVEPSMPLAVEKPSVTSAANKMAEDKQKKPEIIKSAAVNEAQRAQASGKKGIKDPKTGEIATAYYNYRFTKRWIKEALVAEGLLEKVYKNNELDAETEAKIKDAIQKLEAMDKYRA
ncbi:conserved hypothetical protein [Candidatus Methylobacter favarea]|uniref:Uncharacterized protein n=1 Tax=Candidatus Methylobacter favarea TaxID=2707345 RepID=A0A8S0X6P1_9GAMM|nr:hypothetical protein [Candidatus Methylobacter favarea]CAA9889395.1 conserved hypothetical protein [Candidatus Methylobacter favarea]